MRGERDCEGTRLGFGSSVFVDVNLAEIMGGRRGGPKRLGWDPGLGVERGVLLPPGRITRRSASADRTERAANFRWDLEAT